MVLLCHMVYIITFSGLFSRIGRLYQMILYLVCWLYMDVHHLNCNWFMTFCNPNIIHKQSGICHDITNLYNRVIHALDAHIQVSCPHHWPHRMNAVNFVSLRGQICCGAFSQRGDQKRRAGHDKKQVVFPGMPWMGGGLATKHGGFTYFNRWTLKHEHMEELIGDG